MDPQKPQKPPRPNSVSSLPHRQISHIELRDGQDYQLNPTEAFRVVDGDVSVYLVITPTAEPIFCYDVGKGGIVHPEALIDPFELPGILRIVAQKPTRLEAISAAEFRADYARVVGNAGSLMHFRPRELEEFRNAAFKSLFPVGNAVRELAGKLEQLRKERRQNTARAALSGAPLTEDDVDMLFELIEEQIGNMMDAAFGLPKQETATPTRQIFRLIKRNALAAIAAKRNAKASALPEPPPPAREKFATLTGEDGLGGLIPVTEEEPPPPAWLAAEPTSDIHNRITPINVPPPTTQPSPRTSTIGQPPVASRRLTLPFIQAPPEHADRPASPPPAPSVRIDAPRQEPAPEPKANDFEEDDFEIVDGVRIAKRTTALGLDPISSQWADVHRSSAPPAPVPKPPPPPSNPRGGLDRTLSGVGGMMPPQSKPRPSAPGSAPKPPPLPPRSR